MLSGLDAPNYGPHSAGFTLLLFPLLAAWLAAALWRRRWLRLGALAALAVCIVCGRQLSREQLCPECDAEYFAAQTEDQIEDESE